jgi:hypothetical protein
MDTNSNTLSTLANNGKPSLLGRNRIVLAPLALGKHSARVVAVEEKIASNKNPYVNFTFRMDDEPANRTRALFEVEFGMFTAGVGDQLNMLGANETDIITAANTQPFNVWLVNKDNPEDPDHPFTNWYYTEPRQSASTAPEPNVEVHI